MRIWVRNPSDRVNASLAAEAGAGVHVMLGGLTRISIAHIIQTGNVFPEMFTLGETPDERFSGTLPGRTFIGFPLIVDGAMIGYAETYTNIPPRFSFSAQIEQEAAEISLALATALSVSEQQHTSRGKILIVDDNAGTRMTLRKILGNENFTVIDAQDGAHACEIAARDRPDLVLMDWNMPVMDGRTAIERLKADPVMRQIPVVMLTSLSNVDDKISAFRAGAQDFLTKPFNERELIARVDQQLRWRKMLSSEAVEIPKEEEPAPLAVSTPPPPEGDIWSRAAEAQQMGRYSEALSLFLTEAEISEDAKHYPRSAIAYRSASLVAMHLGDRDLSNKLMRSAGKMHFFWAEEATDARSIQEGYLSSARCFLASGNIHLAKKSMDLAHSLESVMSDDQLSLLDGKP